MNRKPENQRHVFLDGAEIEPPMRRSAGDNNRSAALALRLALLPAAGSARR